MLLIKCTCKTLLYYLVTSKARCVIHTGGQDTTNTTQFLRKYFFCDLYRCCLSSYHLNVKDKMLYSVCFLGHTRNYIHFPICKPIKQCGHALALLALGTFCLWLRKYEEGGKWLAQYVSASATSGQEKRVYSRVDWGCIIASGGL